MAALYASFVAGWLLLLAVFTWLHRPEPSIAEIVRDAGSRS